MTWQEYQNAVAELYQQMDDIGTVHRNVYLPDKVTRQKRQIDVWIEVPAKNVTLRILVDAKFYKTKLDVKDIEEVIALSDAVNADKTIIVTSNGWSESAQKRAKHSRLELHLWSMEEALDLLIPDKWIMCSSCKNDCIIMDDSGGIIVEDLWSIFVSGQCRECRTALIWCWGCGGHFSIELGEQVNCWCDHLWNNQGDEIFLKSSGDCEFQTVSQAIQIFRQGG